MEIINDYPPNYEKIIKVFDLTGRKPIFCWGGVIYNPHAPYVDPHLIVHESIHSEQQKVYGGVEAWWDRYLSDAKWRVIQEVEAYKEQYHNFIKSTKDREKKHKYVMGLASQLSSPMYGSPILQNHALKLIKNDISHGIIMKELIDYFNGNLIDIMYDQGNMVVRLKEIPEHKLLSIYGKPIIYV